VKNSKTSTPEDTEKAHKLLVCEIDNPLYPGEAWQVLGCSWLWWELGSNVAEPPSFPFAIEVAM
jgi:hypothetical protein